MQKIRRFTRLAAPYRVRIVFFIIFNLFTAVFNVFSIAIIIPFLKIIFRGDEGPLTPVAKPEGLDTNAWLSYFDYKQALLIQDLGAHQALVFFSGFIILMFLLKNVFHFLSFFNLAYIRSAVVRDIRQRLYAKWIHLPMGYYGKQKKGDLMSRFSNDVKDIEWSLLGVLEVIYKHPFSIIVPLVSLFITSWQMTVFVIVVLPVSGFVISRLGKKLKDAAQKGQEKLSVVTSLLEETLGGVKIIKSFNAENRLKKRFNKLNDDHFWMMVKLHRRELAASPLSEFMSSIVIAMILVFGGYLVLNENIALSGEYFIAYVAIFSQLIPPSKALSEGFFRMQKGLASLDRVEYILDEPHAEISDSEGLVRPKFEDKLSFKNVAFRYDDQPVLRNVSFDIKKGQTVALVGPSGGGKSTIADLCLRFYDVKEGVIELDGEDIRKMALAQWRHLFGMVTQESILFNDSVSNNIKLSAPNASHEEVVAAAKLANAHEFITELDRGYESSVGDRGMNLSGGQMQRIAIARAVLKNPPFLILDEATSALDTESEHLVQEALNKVMKLRTSLVIAHRLSTVKSADTILVLEKGKIIEQGNHDDLIAHNGMYKKLIDMQELG